jgi:hypothetical protein
MSNFQESNPLQSKNKKQKEINSEVLKNALMTRGLNEENN